MRSGKVVFDREPSALSSEELKHLYQLSEEEMMKDA
jgi:ABC-type phosphate/phosphonate transport system ATPase subunit